MKKNLIRSFLDLDSLDLLSRKAEASPLQDPFRIRARYVGWKAASLLIDERGDLNQEALTQLLRALEEGCAPVGSHEGDAWIYQHLLSVLRKLHQGGSLWKAIKKCSLPLCSKEAEEIVRDTLWPDEAAPLTHAHVRRAVLTAALTLLRQATGSCFATAPAILIQQEDPLRLVRDLDAVLSAGELRRGAFAAPLHSGSGLGDLQKKMGGALFSPGLQAAFHAAGAEVPKTILPDLSAKQVLEESLLARFGLTGEDLAKEAASLSPQFGVLWERIGGHFGGISTKGMQIRSWEKAVAKAKRAFLSLADCALLRSWEYTLASFADVKVEFARWNLYVSLGLHPEASPPGIGAALLRIVQEKLDQANSRISQAGLEYQRAVQAVRTRERLLESALSDGEQSRLKAEILAEMHGANSLSRKIEEEKTLARFLSQFYSFFLKVAVEKLQISFQEVFDPALGIAKEELFEDSSAGFRLLYKSGRSAAASWERIEDEGGFVGAVYKFFEALESQMTIEPPMQSCFTLMMTELLQYIRSDAFIAAALERARKNKHVKQAFPWAYESGGTMQTLLQSYFEMPARPEGFSQTIASPLELESFLRKAAEKAAKDRHLMLSPTHAFLFCPHLMGPSDALERSLRFIKGISLTGEQMEFLIDQFAKTVPPDARPHVYAAIRARGVPNTLSEFRSLMHSFITAIDGFLYRALPLLTQSEARHALDRLAYRLGIRAFAKELKGEFILAHELIEIMKQSLLQEKGPFSSVDWDWQLANAAREEGIIYPEPVLFADTNWSDWLFGIVRNVATGEAELWRLSRTGVSGFPMSEWKPVFLEKSRWSVFI